MDLAEKLDNACRDFFTLEFNADLQMFYDKPISDIDESTALLSDWAQSDLYLFTSSLQESLHFDFEGRGDIDNNCKTLADLRSLCQKRFEEALEERKEAKRWMPKTNKNNIRRHSNAN